jgi:hypothetical protein
VETGVLYFYLVKAIDTSFNLSSYSNAVHHVAEAKMVSVTIDVIVPDITVGTVYVVGNHPSIGDWNPGSVALTKVDDFKWSITLDILDGTSLEFKFTRGSWDTVMKGADGDEELANLTVLVQYGDDGTQLFEYTVLNWRDPIVTAYSPLDGATDVTLDVILTTTWNQEMASDACFVLTGPEGTVAGTCSYDALSKTISFTPSSPLLGMTTYTVTVSGLKDANNDTQQVPLSWMFTTMPITYYLPLITN